MLKELEELGFTPGTIGLLPLIPVLRVAWAEGGVSAAERKAIVALARARGIVAGSVGDHQLTTWLDHRPSAETFTKAMRLIAAIIQHPSEGHLDITADDGQFVLDEQVVVPVDASADRVLHRQDPAGRPPLRHGGKYLFEAVARQYVRPRRKAQRRRFAVGAAFSLERNTHLVAPMACQPHLVRPSRAFMSEG
jgi:hypothetical protein